MAHHAAHAHARHDGRAHRRAEPTRGARAPCAARRNRAGEPSARCSSSTSITSRAQRSARPSGRRRSVEARRAQAARRGSEPAFIGRLGGEEFVVVMPDAGVEARQQLAEHFSESVPTIDTRRWLADRRLTVSIGITCPGGRRTSSHMLQRADAALYEAKRAGRNCVRQQLPAPEANAATKTSPAESRLQEANHACLKPIGSPATTRFPSRQARRVREACRARHRGRRRPFSGTRCRCKGVRSGHI